MLSRLLDRENGILFYQYMALFGLFVFIVADFMATKKINEFLAGAWIGLMFAPGKEDVSVK